MYLGSWKIDDYLTFTCNTHTPSTGAATDADAVPAYRVYEDETGTPVVNGDTAKLDDAGTTGFYSERIQLTAASGFEKGKSYTIYISAAVGGVTGTMSHSFQVEAEVDANVVSGVVPSVAGAVGSVTGAVGSVTGNVGGNVVGSVASVAGAVGSVTGAVGSVTGNVGGNVTGSVASVVGHTAQTGDSFARLGAPAGVSVSADLVVIDNFVDDLETRLSAARAGYLDNLSGGAVALAATALTDVTWTDAKAAFLDASVQTVDTVVDSILADTNMLQTDWVNGGRLDLILDIIAVDTTTDIPALIAALNDVSAAEVNAQVVDVMKTDTVAEPGQGAPPATPTFEEMVSYLYFYFRNKTETTATEHAVYDNAGTTKLVKSTISDDSTTFTKGEFGTGA